MGFCTAGGIAGALGGGVASGADLLWGELLQLPPPEIRNRRRPRQKAKPVAIYRHASVRHAAWNAA